MVAQQEDLGVLGDFHHPMEARELDDATDQAVKEPEPHGPAGSPRRSCLVKLRLGLLDPSGQSARVPVPSDIRRQLRATPNCPQAGGDCHRSIAATSSGVAGRMEGHPNPFSTQTNCFSSPPPRATESFLDRRKPPRKCRLKECSPDETWYTLICLGEMAPTFEPSRKTLTTPPSPTAGRRRWPRASRDTARRTTRVGNAGQIRFGARDSWMVAPASSSTPGEVSPSLVAATTSDLSRLWFIVLSYTDRR
jgi:hypothetical protein